ncbi:MAG TPA: sodium:proton antiporter [Sediminispirochaeta sp.]|nr:sodium:proton antiporter [Sediminispirochaeta sp.]
MLRRIFAAFAVVLLAMALLPFITEIHPFQELSPVARHYAEKGPDELGGANLVTSVIVTYRGLDTLGEVTVLFIATAGVGFLLRRDERDEEESAAAAGTDESGSAGNSPRPASELLMSGSMLLFPLLMLFGVYIFLHGHLTPGGGFQGGVVIASAMLLVMLSRVSLHLNHTVLGLVESLSGFSYVVIGVVGLVLAGGFLDNRILPLGELGNLLSAGAIPVIYSLVGLKVGTELTNILETMKSEEEL